MPKEKPNLKTKPSLEQKSINSDLPIDKQIINEIQNLEHFHDYEVRQLVNQAEQFGRHLKEQRLETNQIRKFLDAINRLKAKLAQNADQENLFSSVEPEIVLLQPKLAYVAARQKAAKPLSDVISVAIKKVHTLEDFNRLVQFIEAIIAYHKAAEGN